MTLVPLLPIFHDFNRKYFNRTLTIASQPKVSVRWSDGRLRKTAGFYRRRTNLLGQSSAEIVLSRPVLEYLPHSATESTLCHEMIHAWIDLVLGLKEGHGPHFHARMDMINSCQDSFQVTVRHKFPLPKVRPKWWAVCSSCGKRFPYRRRMSGAACRKCWKESECDFDNFCEESIVKRIRMFLFIDIQIIHCWVRYEG